MCEFCKSVVRTDRLTRHIRKVHKKSVISCPLCKENISRSALTKHIFKVHAYQNHFLHELYGYKRTIHLYAAENDQPLKHVEGEFSDHEITKSTLPSAPCGIKYIFNNEKRISNSDSETDFFVVITQTRTITLRNPSQDELKNWLREYKRWL